MLEEAERLKRYLTLFSIIGVRLMHVAYLARAQPDLPATEVFSAEEIEALHVRVTKALPPAGPAADAARDGAHARQARRAPGAQGRRGARRHRAVARLDASVRDGGDAARPQKVLGLVESS